MSILFPSSADSERPASRMSQWFSVWVDYLLCMHATPRHSLSLDCLILTHAWWFWQMCGQPPSKSGISAFIMTYDTNSFHIWQWREAITLQCLTCYPSHHYACLMGSLPQVNGLHAVSKQLFYSGRYMHNRQILTRDIAGKGERYRITRIYCRLIFFERFYSSWAVKWIKNNNWQGRTTLTK